MTFPPLVIRGLAACLVFAGAWAAGRTAVALSLPGEKKPAPMSSEDRARRLAGVRLTAPLAAGVVELLRPDDGDPYLLVALRDGDLRTCEDLGRQLRDLRRGELSKLPAVLLTDSASEPGVRAFLGREKLRMPLHVLPTVDHVLQRSQPLPTPAALIVAAGRADGIAFPNRYPGVRSQSFAQALATLAAPTRSGAARPDLHPIRR